MVRFHLNRHPKKRPCFFLPHHRNGARMRTQGKYERNEAILSCFAFQFEPRLSSQNVRQGSKWLFGTSWLSLGLDDFREETDQPRR
jgi:hypothetical protein